MGSELRQRARGSCVENGTATCFTYFSLVVSDGLQVVKGMQPLTTADPILSDIGTPRGAAPSDKNDEEHRLVENPSGSMVFATGSMQWSWGLDDYNAPDIRSSRLSEAAQQITTNVLALLIRRLLHHEPDFSGHGSWAEQILSPPAPLVPGALANS